MADRGGEAGFEGRHIRVRGLVQGVGFRPTVWRLARDLGLSGEVRNDGAGVVIRVWGGSSKLDHFVLRLQTEAPPLARVERVEQRVLHSPPPSGTGFCITASDSTSVQTGVVPDAATCAACSAEVLDPSNRRFRYPFTNCTHCGPRLSIVYAIPYDRANTSMARFAMCPACLAEYRDPADRRFHAQPNACPVCGPRVWLEDARGRQQEWGAWSKVDALDAAAELIDRGRILAVKGIGGFHLACDAGNAEAVERLRRRKQRIRKPFALMARDPHVIARYCKLSPAEERLLQAPAAPVVLLERRDGAQLAPDLAPGQRSLGFMLPYSPLHLLLLQRFDRPLVFTSGNRSDEPQCTDNERARRALSSIADVFLLHDREIANRVDDSVVRSVGAGLQPLRRARGYAPEPITLPAGLEQAPELIALGGELKNTFCLVKDGRAILSQHLGDLEEASAFAEYRKAIGLFSAVYQHRPKALVVDAHPGYRSTRFGREWASRESLPLAEVQHHHAHIAACMADNGLSLDHPRVLGIAFDGLGYGADGGLWGGEFLLADYLGYERLGHLRSFPLIGGVRAVLEPWRNAFAQLRDCVGWSRLLAVHDELELVRSLGSKPIALLEKMLEQGMHCPPTSSAGRWFDAVAAAVGVARDRLSYEGEAAMELEALVCEKDLAECAAYPFGRLRVDACLVIDPAPMWAALLADLTRGQPPARVAASFHLGLSRAVAGVAGTLARERAVSSILLSGGVLQNLVFTRLLRGFLESAGLQVLVHHRVPANDGGLSLGQAVIGAARRCSGEA